jgi:tRNA-specific 2-thiouridylase
MYTKLEIDKEPKDTTIVVAMSGGVDSSTVAAMLVADGYKVIGITLQLYDYGAISAKKGACCAGQDIYDAKMVAARLDIPHYVLNYESKFKQAVIDDFAQSYLNGQTPLPCVRCNQSVKFKDLLRFAKELGADCLATGHYVQRIQGANGPELHKGSDAGKDQSYFLFTTTKEQLAFTHFPLGSLTKEQTRSYATLFNLKVADKPDSQDICFVPDGKYADFVSKMHPEAQVRGKIFHVDGYELGIHEGIINYTIGQRKGLKIAIGTPLYVIKIDPQNNIVYVGPYEALNKQEFIIKDINWLGENLVADLTRELIVKIRSTHNGAYARIYNLDNNKMQISLLSSEKSITPGQACVIYDANRVLGGGWIERY